MPLLTAFIIPARMQASRLPGKPLSELAGVPVVVRVAQQAQKCPGSMVAVATDSADIARVVAAYGVTVIMTHSSHQSGTDRVAEAAAKLQAEAVINVQGDEPFVHPQDLQDIVVALRQGLAPMVTLKCPIASYTELLDPNVTKVVCRQDDTALYFSRAPLPFDQARGQSIAHCFRHIGVYGYQEQALQAWRTAQAHPVEKREGLEQLRALTMGLSIAVLEGRTRGRGIDTPEDLAWARAQVERLGEAAFPNMTEAEA